MDKSDLASFDTALVAGGFGLVAGAWAHYWPKVYEMNVPRVPWKEHTAMVAGIGMSGTGFMRNPNLLTGIGAALSTIGGGFFIYSMSMSDVPHREPAVSPGEEMLEFEGLDTNGEQFQSTELNGTPYLFHFYRGHW